MASGQAGQKRQAEVQTPMADQVNEAGKKWLQIMAQTQGNKTLKQLTEEQLDAVSGGGPSLWQLLGPTIEAVINAKPKQPPTLEIGEGTVTPIK